MHKLCVQGHSLSYILDGKFIIHQKVLCTLFYFSFLKSCKVVLYKILISFIFHDTIEHIFMTIWMKSFKIARRINDGNGKKTFHGERAFRRKSNCY